MSIHTITRGQHHLAWDNSIEPVLRIKSGSSVTFDCLDASNGQITPSTPSTNLSSLNFSSLDQVNGPIYIEDAKPGDTLQIDVISIETADWGWTGCIPGFGLLSDEFLGPELKIWTLNKDSESGDRGFAWFDEDKGIKIPLRPFAGEMGVARKDKGAFSTIPPYHTGGNIDTRHVVAGSTLYLPVEVEGALFSMGDGHAAQGDGEVCGTAIETPITATVRLTVIKGRSYTKTPHFKTPPPPISTNSTVQPQPNANEEYYCTTGVEPDIKEAARSAVRHMIRFLGEEYGLGPVEAYMLCSVAGDLRLHEVVDMPNYVVRFLSGPLLAPPPQENQPPLPGAWGPALPA